MVLDKNDNVQQEDHNNGPQNVGIDGAPSIDRIRVHRYCAAIEIAVQSDKFGECALLLNELIAQVAQYYKTENCDLSEDILEQNEQTLTHAKCLLYRCQDPMLSRNRYEQGKLRDDVRNGMVLLLSDVFERER